MCKIEQGGLPALAWKGGGLSEVVLQCRLQTGHGLILGTSLLPHRITGVLGIPRRKTPNPHGPTGIHSAPEESKCKGER